ncbi:MAG: alpha/beta hydrolase [Cytophagaceae bacterium]|nr:alpha/beta hydrolase [Cytophagaceae bacterium]
MLFIYSSPGRVNYADRLEDIKSADFKRKKYFAGYIDTMIRFLYLNILLLLCTSSFSFAQVETQTVMIDGVSIQYRSFGKGNITVVFEAGMGEGMDNWKTIPESVSKFAKVLCYNRPGINGAPETKDLPTVPVMANRLNQLIQQVCGNDSIILVAHSMGGYIARYEVSKHPKNVMALILIDPSAEGVYENMSLKETQNFVHVGDSLMASQPPGAQKEQHKQLNKNPWSQHFLIEGGHWFHVKQPKLIVDLIEQIVEKLNMKP